MRFLPPLPLSLVLLLTVLTSLPVTLSKPTTDHDRYSRSLRSSLEGQLDILHRDLAKVITFERHTVATDEESKPEVLRVPKDTRPLAAATPEDRVLRELKQTASLITGRNVQEEYEMGQDRPDVGAGKVAPRTLDPDYEAKVRAAMALGMRPAPAMTSLWHGKLSRKSHYSTVAPGLIASGAVSVDDAVSEERNAYARAKPPARRAGAAAEEIALATDGSTATSTSTSSTEASVSAAVMAATVSADATPESLAALGVATLYEWYSAEMKDHFYTTDAALKDGQWSGRKEICRVMAHPTAGAVPLYMSWSKELLDHSYSLSPQAPTGYRMDGVMAYVYRTAVPGTVPLFEFFDPRSHDHVYGIDKQVLMRRVDLGELQFVGIVCYVLPLRSQPSAISLEAVSQLAESTDVLVSQVGAGAGAGWPPGSGTTDRSMVDQMEQPALPSTQLETSVEEPSDVAQGTPTSNAATEGTSQEPAPIPEVVESARQAVQTAVSAPAATEPPPNALTVDITSPDYRVPKVVAMYEYYNPLIRDHFYTTQYTELADGVLDWKLIGPKFWVFDSQEFNTVPLYMYWNVAKGDHYYTLTMFTNSAYKYVGVAGYVFPAAEKDAVPLYRYFNEQAGDHKYTLTRDDAREEALLYKYEGVQCYVFDSPKDQLVPQDFKSDPGAIANLYRYYNDLTKHHFYTTSTTELAGAQIEHGWNAEGIAGRINIYPEAGLAPLRRYWNVRTLNHYYTTRWVKLGEGWSYDGVQGYVHTSLTAGTVPLYRFFNDKTEDDLYTTDREEMRTRNDREDWKYKGITCYVYSTADEAAVNVHKYFNPKTADYFYTTSFEVFGKGKDGWTYLGAPFSAYNEGVRGTVPVHVYYHPINFDHLYTVNYFPDRKDGWKYQGVAFFAFKEDFDGRSQKLYRFYNPATHTHYYTTDLAEASLSRPGIYAIAQQDGWYFYGITAYVEPAVPDERPRGEPLEVFGFYSKVLQLSAYSLDTGFVAGAGFDSRGVAFKAWGKRGESVKPVYRYFNKDTGINSYDTRVLSGELLGTRGSYDGPAFFIAKRSEEGTIPLYRFQNKDGQTTLTVNPADNNGWEFHGIAGFVLPPKDLSVVGNPMNIYQYYSPLRKEHFYTANWSTLKHGKDGWVLEGVPFRANIFKGNFREPMYDHYDAASKSHTFSTSPTEIGDTRTSIIAFYVTSKKAEDAQVPLLVYRNQASEDKIYCVDETLFTKSADGGLTYRGVAGWSRDTTAKLGFVYKPLDSMADAAVPNGASPVYALHKDKEGDIFQIVLDSNKAPVSQEPAFYAFAESKGESIPLYEYVQGKSLDRIYTTKYFKPEAPWAGGDVVFFVLPRKTMGAVPLYRFNNKEAGLHLYTTDLTGFSPVVSSPETTAAAAAAASSASGSGSGSGSGSTAAATTTSEPAGEKLWTRVGGKETFVYEGVQCYVFPPPKPKLPVYSLYNAAASKHLYTTDVTFTRDGWRNEGAKFWAYGTQFPNTVAANEYVNAQTGAREITTQTFSQLPAGTTQSPKAPFYVFPKVAENTVPLHRYYNEKLADNVYLVDQTLMQPSDIKGLFSFLDNGQVGYKYEGVVGYVFANGGGEEPRQ